MLSFQFDQLKTGEYIIENEKEMRISNPENSEDYQNDKHDICTEFDQSFCHEYAQKFLHYITINMHQKFHTLSRTMIKSRRIQQSPWK